MFQIFLRSKKLLYIIPVMLFLGVGLFYYKTYTGNSGERESTTAKVMQTDLRIAFSVDGKLAIDTYEPGLALSGKVSKVLVKEGDEVKKGQWLVILDTQEAQKNLEKTLRDYSKERNDFEQDMQVTYVDTIVTDTIKRILEKNQWDLDKAVMDVELKDLVLRESRLVSPVEGVVAQVTIKEGDYVSTQNQIPMVTLVKPGAISFNAYAEEDDVLKITTDQAAVITLEAYDKMQFPAKLTFISPLATIDTNGLSSYKVTADLDVPADVKLLDGMEGSISFIAKEVKDVIAIPNKAVQRKDGVTFVLIKEAKDKIVETKIQTGFTDGKNVEVKSGLELGQEVVLPN